MLKKYQRAINGLEWAAQVMLRSHFKIERAHGSLYNQLDQAGLGQAEVVMALIADGRPQMRHAAEAVIGARIQRLRSGMPPPPSPVLPPARTGDARRFTFVVRPNPRLPSTHSHTRFQAFRTGRSVEDFLKRGGTRRDLREALTARWVTLEGDDV